MKHPGLSGLTFGLSGLNFNIAITILVTACSGVAATLIHGQTLHSVTFLNRRGFKNIPEDEAAYF